MHANPFDSVNIFKDTKCKQAMGIHVGHFLILSSPFGNYLSLSCETCKPSHESMYSLDHSITQILVLRNADSEIC